MKKLSMIIAALIAAFCFAPVNAEFIELHTVSITTNDSGDATEYSGVVNGCVLQIHYVPDATAALATGSDLDITLESTGVVVANHDDIGTSAFTKVYRQATHGVDGSASLYAGSGEPTEAVICAANERLKVVIANGGDTGSGVFYIWTN